MPGQIFIRVNAGADHAAQDLPLERSDFRATARYAGGCYYGSHGKLIANRNGEYGISELMSTKKSEYPDLAKNLRTVRKLAKLTQKDLAAKAGCSGATISDIERTKSDGTPALRREIARALGIREESLIAHESKGGFETCPYSLQEDSAGEGRVADRPYAHLTQKQKKQLARKMLEEIFAARGVEQVWDHLVHQLVVLLAVDPEKLKGLNVDVIIEKLKKPEEPDEKK